MLATLKKNATRTLLLLGAAMSLSLVSAPAHASAPVEVAPADAQVQAYPCGWSTSNLWAYYNHCGSGNVVIFVQRRVTSDYYRCVGPGVTRLGLVTSTSGAWYDGRSC